MEENIIWRMFLTLDSKFSVCMPMLSKADMMRMTLLFEMVYLKIRLVIKMCIYEILDYFIVMTPVKCVGIPGNSFAVGPMC